MTMIDPQMTLGELVDEYPTLAREFERRGLDYCCGGGRTLAAACAGRGLDPAETAAELAAAAGERAPADWSTMAVDALCDHIDATITAICGTSCPAVGPRGEDPRARRPPPRAGRDRRGTRRSGRPRTPPAEGGAVPSLLVHELAAAAMPSFTVVRCATRSG
jgi:hypothetical protein